LRNLEQIQEESGRSGAPLGTLFLSALGGGALVVALMMSVERSAPPVASDSDPLAELLARAGDEAATPAMVVADNNVTFPKILSDDSAPTTALAAVKDERGRMIAQEPVAVEDHEGHPGEALPKTARPAGDLLSATSVSNQPQDQLGQLAHNRVTDSEGPSEMAPMGSQGGHEIQVASFQNPADADAFVEELRKRGHSAYRQAAYVPERGLWHRVRIGPFKYKHKALAYQRKLDKEERMASFLVDPEKVKRQEDVKAAKREAREKKRVSRAVITPAED
jgi:cell division septation protein DedD